VCRQKTTRRQATGWVVTAVLWTAISYPACAAQDDRIAKQAGTSPVKAIAHADFCIGNIEYIATVRSHSCTPLEGPFSRTSQPLEQEWVWSMPAR
jgi:hypothetical protein